VRAGVGVNLLWLVPGAVGGSEEYAVRLLGAVAEDPPPDLDITLFALPSLLRSHPGLAERFPTVAAPVDGARRWMRVAAETSWLAAAARRRHLGLVHHLGGTVPLLRGVPAVVTIHDLQPLHHPEHFSPVKRAWLRTILPWSVRAARMVVAVSRFTAADVVDRLGVAADRVRVVPHGAATAPTVGPGEVARVQALLGLGRRWFVYPAVTWPHKNHGVILRAFATVAGRDPDVSLVLTGGRGPSEAVVSGTIATLGLGDRVRRTGRIPRADLDAVIAGATALTFPSSFEGFGAPVVEAMAAGCPVVAARATSLPEVVGDAGILLDPDAPGEWADTMVDLLTNEDRRARLAEAGRARVADMGWDRSAAALVDVWRHALAPSSGP